MAKTKLFYKDKNLIGLDISQTSVKTMAIDPKRWLVQGYGSINLDPAKMHGVLSGDNDDHTYLSEKLKELFQNNIIGSLPSNHCVIGVPTAKSFSRTLSLPANQEKSLSEVIEIEVSQYIPIPLSALYLDYNIIEHQGDDIQIVMSAMPKAIIDAVMRAAAEANLRPIMIEPSINSAARILESTESAYMSSMIIDIGQASTDIAVFDNGAIRVTGGVSIGGNTFTLDIARALNTTLENAHQLKVINGLSLGSRQGKITRALEPSLKRISNEARKVMRYYAERIPSAAKLEQILIIGAGSNLASIGEYFTNSLIMPARVASPWQELNFGKLKQPSKQLRSRYINVTGQASVNEQELWK